MKSYKGQLIFGSVLFVIYWIFIFLVIKKPDENHYACGVIVSVIAMLLWYFQWFICCYICKLKDVFYILIINVISVIAVFVVLAFCLMSIYSKYISDRVLIGVSLIVVVIAGSIVGSIVNTQKGYNSL